MTSSKKVSPVTTAAEKPRRRGASTAEGVPPVVAYSFFPGCSLHSTAREYHDSVVFSLAALGVDLQEVDDWNCCGATALSSTGTLLSYVLPARVLALAQEAGRPLAVACNSCFVTLNRANAVLDGQSEWRERVENALRAIGRTVQGATEIRHTLSILREDVGLKRLRQAVQRPLYGLRVAPYYGCQFSRPRYADANPELPVEMDEVLEAIGADVVRYDRKTKCCGGALMTTKEDVVLQLNEQLLREAQAQGAELIAVCCPMCQMNLDAYQGKINNRFGTRYNTPIVYYSQLVGFALGLSEESMGFSRGFVPATRHLRRYA
ncbi:MAG: disulfide reductase [Bacillota bacterium]|nr:MAG: disulfide reductase [Bacillota bacterium]